MANKKLELVESLKKKAELFCFPIFLTISSEVLIHPQFGNHWTLQPREDKTCFFTKVTGTISALKGWLHTSKNGVIRDGFSMQLKRKGRQVYSQIDFW